VEVEVEVEAEAKVVVVVVVEEEGGVRGMLVVGTMDRDGGMGEMAGRGRQTQKLEHGREKRTPTSHP